MDFDIGADRQMLSDSLRRLIAERYRPGLHSSPAYSGPDYSLGIWRELASLGAVAALFPESFGGLGGDGADIAVVFEELGRGLVMEPFLPALVAGQTFALAGSHTDLIRSTVEGMTLPTFAYYEPNGRYLLSEVSARAVHTANGWRITGSKAVVPYLSSASHILVSARTAGASGDSSGVTLFLVAPDADGLSRRHYALVDGGRAGELALDGTPGALIGPEAAALPMIEQAVASGVVALCWEAVGVMEHLKAATIEHLRTRNQFGGPIGRFQALRHRLVTLAIEIEQARSAAILGAAALEGPPEERERTVSAAKLTIGRVGTLIAEESIQMHGGMGMVWELPVSHYAKRLIMIGHELGDEDYHLVRYIELRSGFAA